MAEELRDQMIKKIFDKVFGNGDGVPGMDKKIDNISVDLKRFSRDNADDHVLILKRAQMNSEGIRINTKQIRALQTKLDKHVKQSKFGSKLKNAGKQANDFVTGAKAFLNNVKETIIIISIIVALVAGIFHKDIRRGYNALKHIETTDSTANNIPPHP